MPAEQPARVTATSWRVVPDLLAREYLIEVASRVITTTDSGTSTDSTELAVEASIRETADGGRSGLVRAATYRPPDGASASLPGLVFPFAFTASSSPADVPLDPVAQPAPSDPCSATSHVALAAVRGALVALPESVTIGRAWADSGTVITCRGGVRLAVSSARAYRVLAHEVRGESDVLVLGRSTRLAIAGSAARRGDTTWVEGSGTENAQLIVSASTGHLIRAEGTGTISVVVRSALRVERAEQSSRYRASLRDP